MRRLDKTGWLLGMILLVTAGTLPAQYTADVVAPSPVVDTAEQGLVGRPIRADVQLVLVNVAVLDDYGRPIPGLRKEDFQVYEDKKPQPIEHFSKEDMPMSVGIIFDASGSMTDKMDRARTAVRQFLRGTHPQDEFFLVVFGNRPGTPSAFTRDAASLEHELHFTEADGGTALLDAIYLGLHQMRNASNSRKVLLIFSDGGDNRSRYTTREIKEAVKESDVQLYAIGIFESGNPDLPQEEREGPFLLKTLTEMTGGRALIVEHLADLSGSVRAVAEEMRNLYILGYTPPSENDGKWRKIQVKVGQFKGMPHMHVFSKSGYYAPQF